MRIFRNFPNHQHDDVGFIRGLPSRISAATHRISLLVDPIDIQQGRRKSVTQCPVALAAKRAFPTAFRIQVTGARVAVFFEEHKESWVAPKFELVDFVDDFDLGLVVEDRPVRIPLRLVARHEFTPDEAVTYNTLRRVNLP